MNVLRNLWLDVPVWGHLQAWFNDTGVWLFRGCPTLSILIDKGIASSSFSHITRVHKSTKEAHS
jgi:hypothetical protein